jgi:hypothetical protein
MKSGVVKGKASGGGWTVLNAKGGTDIVFGICEVGDHVLYQDRQIVTRVKTESTITVYI